MPKGREMPGNGSHFPLARAAALSNDRVTSHGINLADRDLICMLRPAALSRSSLALDNLRAIVILIVLAFHSVLAYVRVDPGTLCRL